jgi:hypothetical protein
VPLKRKRYFVALFVLVVAGIGCGLSGPAADSPAAGFEALAPSTDTQGDQVQASPEALSTASPAAGAPADQPGSFGVESVSAGLATLSSYRLSMALQFEGVDTAGAPIAWRLFSERIVASQPPSSRFDLTAEGAAATSALSAMSVVRIGSESFLAIPGIGCVRGAASDIAAPAGGLGDPDTLLAGLAGARWVASGQVVNEVSSDQYQFDRQAVPLLRDRPLDVAGQIFVAEERGYVTRVTMTATGSNDLLSPGNILEGMLTLELNVSDADRPLSVLLPEACAGSVAYPTLADATELTNLGDLVSYKTRQSLEQIVAFYQEQMPATGWIPVGEAAIFADLAILTFARGDTTVTVNVDPDPQTGVAVVLISP